MAIANTSDAILSMGRDKAVQAAAIDLVGRTIPYKYSYNFEWMGVPSSSSRPTSW